MPSCCASSSVRPRPPPRRHRHRHPCSCPCPCQLPTSSACASVDARRSQSRQARCCSSWAVQRARRPSEDLLRPCTRLYVALGLVRSSWQREGAIVDTMMGTSDCFLSHLFPATGIVSLPQTSHVQHHTPHNCTLHSQATSYHNRLVPNTLWRQVPLPPLASAATNSAADISSLTAGPPTNTTAGVVLGRRPSTDSTPWASTSPTGRAMLPRVDDGVP